MPNGSTIKSVPKMLNAFRQTLVGTEYEGLLPEATSSNIKDFGGTLFEYDILKNRFVNQLVNVIAFARVGKIYFSNPFGFAKRGEIPYGYTIEDIWVDIAKAHSFGADTDDYAMLKTEKPDVKVLYHNRNREDFFKQTISEQQLRAAFMSDGAMERFVDAIVSGLYSSNDVTEFAYVEALLAETINNGLVKQIKVGELTDEASARSFLTAAREASNRFLFPSRSYNPIGVMNTSSRDNQRVFITPRADAIVSVEALAYAFHLDKAEMLGKITLIDEIPGHPEIVAMIADDEFLQIYDNLFESHTFFDPEKLQWNYWLHVWQTLFTSPFHNVVAFTTGAVPVINSVAVAGADTYTPNVASPFKATITGTGNPPSGVRWLVSGNTAESTRIDNAGILYPAPSETGTLTIKAIPWYDSSKSGEKTVTKSA